MSNYEADSNRYFDYIIIIIICIIFFLVFVIQMTIFDFYKRPSIYELEIYNEFKKKSGCSHPCKSGGCKCSSGGGEEKTTQEGPELFSKSYTEANFYKDIIYFIVYINIMYFSSLFFSDFVLTFIGIILISIMLYIKHFSLKSL